MTEASSQGWLIDCQVCLVYRLGIKCVCSRCGGVFIAGVCQSEGCGNTKSEIITDARLVF